MEKITVKNIVNAPLNHVWDIWTTPSHIVNWNAALDSWHSPKAENDLRIGGQFNYRMEAKDGSFGFDFGGTYDEVIPLKKIAYTLGDGRKVEITFNDKGATTEVSETFETEDQNPAEMQRQGWQAILDNFKKYAESTLTVDAATKS